MISLEITIPLYLMEKLERILENQILYHDSNNHLS